MRADAVSVTSSWRRASTRPTGSHAEYVEGNDSVYMIKADPVAERVAIDSYNEIIRWLGNKDVTTRQLMEDILAVEEGHADDLLILLHPQ